LKKQSIIIVTISIIAYGVHTKNSSSPSANFGIQK